jgi:hypothetical protein
MMILKIVGRVLGGGRPLHEDEGSGRVSKRSFGLTVPVG